MRINNYKFIELSNVLLFNYVKFVPSCSTLKCIPPSPLLQFFFFCWKQGRLTHQATENRDMLLLI